MKLLGALSQSCVSVLLSTILLDILCSSAVGANDRSAKRPVKVETAPSKVVFDAYGLPAEQLENMLRSRLVSQVRTVLARTARHQGDEDVRQSWLAACLSIEEKYEESVVEFAKVKHFDGASGYVLYLAARAYAQTQDFAKAIELSSLGLERGKAYQNYEIRAGCYNVQKRFGEAALDYEKLAISNPRLASDYYCKAASAMLQANKPAEALALAGKAPPAGRGGGNVPALFTKAVCFERLNQLPDAVTMLTKAIALAQANPSNHVEAPNMALSNCLAERAKCFEKLGKKAEAAADRRLLEKVSRGIENDLLGKQR